LAGSLGIGALVEAGGYLSLHECSVTGNAAGGAVARGRACGEWAGCDVVENGGCGVEVSHEADPVIRACAIERNGQHGVWVHTGGWGSLEANVIAGNGGAGLLIQSEGDPTVEANTIEHNTSRNLVVEKGGWGRTRTPRGGAPGGLPAAGEPAPSQTCGVS